jgi:MoxR-like ATPase
MSSVSDPVDEVIESLSKSKNVLLYGPPGTGKTWLISEVMKKIQNTMAVPAIVPGKFTSVPSKPLSGSLPSGISVQWVTFHQSYTYEEFIIGKRPKPEGSGIVLQPYLGILMSLAFELDGASSDKGYLLIIDEINRANASQVFGELITLLDPDYRATIDHKDNSRAVKIRLPGISYTGGISEPIMSLKQATPIHLPEDWVFPENVFILATMNSADKAALPLDSALTRRFHKIEMPPDLSLLAGLLGVKLSEVKTKVTDIRSAKGVGSSDLSAEEATVLILDRVNYHVAQDIGEDFELGHALFSGVVKASPSERFEALAVAWDNIVWPQLLERYAGRPEELKTLLKVESGSGTSPAFFERVRLGTKAESDAPLTITKLKSLEPGKAKLVLQALSL